jgi:hypothetical protein
LIGLPVNSVHLPATTVKNPPAPAVKGLRRLASRVSGSRRTRPEPVPVPPSTAPTVAAASDPVPVISSRPFRRADPVLRWKDPSHAPDGDFSACAMANALLRVHGIPRHGDSWDAVSSFSLSYDGYAYWDDVSELATRSTRHWTRDRTLPSSVDELRACLFYEQRRWHHFGEVPNGRGERYVWALLDALRNVVAARTVDPVSGGDRSVAAITVIVSAATPSEIRSFLDDDAGYLTWASDHSDGFVVNADRTLSPNSLMLHRARCSCIGGPAGPGRTRTGNYRKVCGPNAERLLDWCRTDIGAEPASCGHCRPGTVI